MAEPSASGAAVAGAEALFYRGLELGRQGHAGAALEAYGASLALNPGIAEVHANIALLHDQAGRDPEAEQHYRRALELKPGQIQTLINFGALCVRLKRLIEADTLYRQALALDPGSLDALTNRGVLMALVKREDLAEQCYREVLQRTPDHAKARFNLSYLLLRQGRYAEGWAALEARDWYRDFATRLTCPRWQGEDLTGRSVLVAVEAGFGDMIQFCRYLPLLRTRGARRVVLLCQPPLARLMASLAGVDEVLPLDRVPADRTWDVWTMPLSLPFHFGTRLDSIPAALPYLAAEPESVAAWARRLPAQRGRPRVGLVWRGNARFENDDQRSLPGLASLAPLGALAGVDWFSLQKGAGECEAADPPAPLVLTDLGPAIDDFADTAAILMNLDLVITVDTAVAHLAGALNRPCWVLLPDYMTDWRWLTGRDDTPWYPQVMRLFRQPRPGAWDVVVEAVANALIEQGAA